MKMNDETQILRTMHCGIFLVSDFLNHESTKSRATNENNNKRQQVISNGHTTKKVRRENHTLLVKQEGIKNTGKED